MAVARDDCEAADSFIAYQVVDFRTLNPGGAMIAAAEIGEAGGPRLGEAGWQVLRIGAPIETAQRAAPDFPCRGRTLELVLEPGFLLRAQDGLRRVVPDAPSLSARG